MLSHGVNILFIFTEIGGKNTKRYYFLYERAFAKPSVFGTFIFIYPTF